MNGQQAGFPLRPRRISLGRAGILFPPRACLGLAAFSTSPVRLIQNEPLARVSVVPCVKAIERKIDWPTWATVALVATFLTAVLTLAATINDIW